MSVELVKSRDCFDAWLKRLMTTNNLKTWDDLAKKLYISRQSLFNWRKDPRKLDVLTLCGIKSLLGDEEHALDVLCKSFGIACKSE